MISRTNKIEIILNGKPAVFKINATIQDVIVSLNLVGEPVVAELNGRAIPKEEFATTILDLDNKLELVKLVGGG